MRAVQNREDYHLLIHTWLKYLGYEISDYFGEEFDRRYQAVLADERIIKTKVPAIQIMKAILKSSFETGLPYVFFRDTANEGILTSIAE